MEFTNTVWNTQSLFAEIEALQHKYVCLEKEVEEEIVTERMIRRELFETVQMSKEVGQRSTKANFQYTVSTVFCMLSETNRHRRAT
jgi:hypothetical protein